MVEYSAALPSIQRLFVVHIHVYSLRGPQPAAASRRAPPHSATSSTQMSLLCDCGNERCWYGPHCTGARQRRRQVIPQRLRLQRFNWLAPTCPCQISPAHTHRLEPRPHLCGLVLPGIKGHIRHLWVPRCQLACLHSLPGDSVLLQQILPLLLAAGRGIRRSGGAWAAALLQLQGVLCCCCAAPCVP